MALISWLSFYQCKRPSAPTLLCASMGIFVINGVAHAAPDQKVSRIKPSIGASVVFNDSGYKDQDGHAQVLPSAYFDNQRGYLRGSQLGAYLYDNGRDQLSLTATYDGQEFDPDDADGELKQLDKRRWSALAGLSYQHRVKLGAIRLQADTDVLDRHNGSTASAAFLTRINKFGAQIYPQVGIDWQSQNYNQYYYGVTSKETARSSVRTYTPDASVDPYLSVAIRYPFSKHLVGLANQKVSYLSSEQTNSPIVDGNVSATSVLGLSYQFN